jgi:hypothetical protein
MAPADREAEATDDAQQVLDDETHAELGDGRTTLVAFVTRFPDAPLASFAWVRLAADSLHHRELETTRDELAHCHEPELASYVAYLYGYTDFYLGDHTGARLEFRDAYAQAARDADPAQLRGEICRETPRLAADIVPDACAGAH